MKHMLVLAGVSACAALMCSCHSAPEQSEVGRYVLTPAGVTTIDPNHPDAHPIAAAWVLDSRTGALRYCTVSSTGALGC